MSASRQRGTRFETSLLPLLREHYPLGAERRASQGAADKGDYLLVGETRFILEAKNVTRMAIPEWLAEAEAEARRAGVPHGVVVAKRKGRTLPADQYVHLTLGSFLALVTP